MINRAMGFTLKVSRKSEFLKRSWFG